MRLIFFLFLVSNLLLISCSTPNETASETKKTSEISGKEILNRAIIQHGGTLYDSAYYQFEFRGTTYTFHNQREKYTYTKSFINETDTLIDVLSNDRFERSINGVTQILNDSQKTQFSENLNSVIYFATLPHKLTDPAVITAYKGQQTISDQDYDMVKVTFSAKNGGADFEDAYQYWVNKKDNTIDFLAYNYQVNGGGVRFRKAYNRRIIEGVYFQDYINFKAPVGTALDSLALLFEKDQLEELSRIETEKILSLK